MSPYIFLLDIEGLSLLFRNSKEPRTITGVCFVGTINLNHLIFLDDVLMFGNGSVEEWCSFCAIISLFCEAYGLDVSEEKSIFIFANVDEGERYPFVIVLDFKMVDFLVGFKYLIFFLKLVGYTLKDWEWLL